MHRHRILPAAIAAALVSCTTGLARSQSVDLARVEMVDLTHAFNTSTIYWPTAPSGFTFMHLSHGHTPGGYFYSAGAFNAPEHGGTHLDAPIHFFENGQAVEQIPLERLMGPAVVVDVRASAAGNPDYEVGVVDITSHSAVNGPIAKGTIVLIRTGWASRWGDRRAYLGDDTPGDASSLHFPGLSAEAARYLADKGVAAVGIDTASLDPGRSTDFQAHRVLARAGVPGFENLNIPETLPAKGITVLALPMKIEGGSGAPLRAVALVPRR
ncbi:MAG TPA: cyclase family protein [Candidatus Limnocylindrales bacterium]|nr:cyclase family protein [Candidatus Limnocylindrales bacterium]